MAAKPQDIPAPDLEGRRRFLSGVPLLAQAPEPLVKTLTKEFGLATYERGERIFSEGDTATTFYLVQSGFIKVLRETASGRSVLFEILGPGEMLGAVAVVDQKPFPATAVAGSEAELLTLGDASFAALLEKYSALRQAYVREINHRVREAREWQTQVASPIEGRIARLFLRLAERMGKRDGERVAIERILTRQEVADIVGTTVETAIRVLSRWNKEGLVSTEREEFVIEKLPKLIEMVGKM